MGKVGYFWLMLGLERADVRLGGGSCWLWARQIWLGWKVLWAGSEGLIEKCRGRGRKRFSNFPLDFLVRNMV